MFSLSTKLYNGFLIIICYILTIVLPNCCNSIIISNSNLYTSNLNFLRNLNGGFYTFVNIQKLKNDLKRSNYINSECYLFGKPIYQSTPPPKSLIPKHVPLDYENLLRSHDPSVINFNTRLTGFPGVNIRDIDDLYGQIYDRRVLMKQLRYFLENDDFHSITRLLRYNREVLNKSDCELLADDFEHLMFERLKYEYPEEDNLERTIPFLVSRYVCQHVMQQDLESRLSYLWIKPGEIPEVPEHVENYVEPKSSPENPIHIKDTLAYRTLLERLNTYNEHTRLCILRNLFNRMIGAKRKKLIRGLRKFQKLKPFRFLSYRRKVSNKVDIDRVSPFLSRPMRCTDEIVNEYTSHFEEAVNKQDLATACRLLNRYSRRIIFIDKFPLLKKFMKLFADIHASKKYNLDALKSLREYYWSTVKRHKFLIRYNEPMMIMEAGKTMKDMYEEQLEQYRKWRDAKRDEKMKKMGIDMEKIRDFSNTYGQDWIPILYPEQFEEAIEIHRERLEKMRRRAAMAQEKLKKKNRFELFGDDDEEEELE